MNRPLRILTIGHSYVVALNRALIREVASDPSFDITVAAPNLYRSHLGPIQLQPEPPGSPLKLTGLDTKWSCSVYAFFYDRTQLGRLLQQGNFDVVHAWEEPYIYAGYQIARAVGSGRLSPAYCFRTAQSLVKRYPPPFSYFERYSVERADGWVAGGHLVLEAALNRGYPASRGHILTLAVDTCSFRPLGETASRSVRQELQLQPPVLGFVGRLTATKGLDVIMSAMELLNPARPWSLLILGSGPYEATLTQWAKKHHWSDRVRVKLVAHSDVPKYLGAMDLLLAPSRTTHTWKEQFGRMVIEAFASGVPVLASDSGEIPYVVADAGWIVPEANVTAWASAIEELLDTPALRTDMARRGLGRASIYSTFVVAKQYRDYYRWLYERHQGVRPH
jgi:phosphatidyl-myo-inositol dimannoside synthase